MKSTKKQLENRGFFSTEIENFFAKKSFIQLLELLKSKSAIERTVSARLITNKKNPKSISYLCTALQIETKLYSKIEISNSLASYGQLALPKLIELLGKIGNNQHKHIPKTEFKKKSYPLPRDIAARTIIRIGAEALPLLVKTLNSNDTEKISEAIDAIGYICFYNKPCEKIIIQQLENCYKKYSNNELVRWKIMQAISFV